MELPVEGAEWLVEQQQPRAGGEGPGQRHPLGFAARERRDAPALEAVETDELQQLGHPLAHFGLRPPGDGWPEAHVAGHVTVGEQLVVLEDQTELPPMRRHLGDVLSVPQHAAAVGRVEPGDDPQQRALARAAGPEEGDDLARPDREVGAVEHPPVPEADPDVLDGQHGQNVAASPRRRSTARMAARVRTIRTVARA